MEQITSTGQLFCGLKFTGVANTATALGGAAFPPCAANDFSCALRGTFAFTVEPGETGTSANVKEGAAAARHVQAMLSVKLSPLTKSNVFKRDIGRNGETGEAPIRPFAHSPVCLTLANSPPCLSKIRFIDFETDKLFHSAALGRNSRVSDTEKRIEHCLDP